MKKSKEHALHFLSFVSFALFLFHFGSLVRRGLVGRGSEGKRKGKEQTKPCFISSLCFVRFLFLVFLLWSFVCKGKDRDARNKGTKARDKWTKEKWCGCGEMNEWSVLRSFITFTHSSFTIKPQKIGRKGSTGESLCALCFLYLTRPWSLSSFLISFNLLQCNEK